MVYLLEKKRSFQEGVMRKMRFGDPVLFESLKIGAIFLIYYGEGIFVGTEIQIPLYIKCRETEGVGGSFNARRGHNRQQALIQSDKMVVPVIFV